MKTILLVALTLGWAATSGPALHEFEDGFVERTLEVVIRDNVATAKYSIGLNETTLCDLLDQWKKSHENPHQTQRSQHNETIIADQSLGTNDQAEITEVAKPAVGSKPKVEPEPTESLAESAPKPDEFGTVKKSSAVPQRPVEPARDGEGEEDDNPIQQQLLAELQSLGPEQIARGVVVTCDGKPLKIRNVTADLAPRHPFVLVVKFEFEIPATKSAILEIKDQNFREQTGAVRYAIKALGNLMLVKSDAAPIIIRAKRLELAELSKKETISKTSISAQLLLMSNPEKGD